MEIKLSIYYCIQNLKERGWTKAGIIRFLGNPDKTSPNPKYRNSGPDMCLYEKTRVEQVECSVIFCKWKEKSMLRKIAAQKAVETKYNQTLNEALKWEPIIPDIPLQKLQHLAIENYNNSTRSNSYACITSNVEFLNRIMVNYLRHECSQYDCRLVDNQGKVGKIDAYKKIKHTVLLKIATLYPSLEKEVIRQLNTIDSTD